MIPRNTQTTKIESRRNRKSEQNSNKRLNQQSKSSYKEKPGPDDLPSESYQMFKKELALILHKCFQKMVAGLPSHFVRLVFPWHQNQTKTSPENQKPTSLWIQLKKKKKLNKILVKWIQQYIKRIKHSDQVGCIAEMKDWFNVWKSY